MQTQKQEQESEHSTDSQARKAMELRLNEYVGIRTYHNDRDFSEDSWL